MSTKNGESASSGMVPSIPTRSGRGAQASTGTCGQVRFNGPGRSVAMLAWVLMKLLLSTGSMPSAVALTTAKPAPVGPEWPHIEPGMMVCG